MMSARSRRDRRESGSILVELALVVPFLMLMVAGMIEVGAAWRDKSTVVQATRQGARVASHLGAIGAADSEALLALTSVMPTGGPQEGLSKDLTLNKVVIFKNNGSTPAQIQTCKDFVGNGGIAGICNVYTTNNGHLNPVNFVDANFANGSWDSNWNPQGRSTVLTSADEVGVYIEAERPFLTNIFPGQQTQKITAFTIMRLEPPAP